MSTGTELVCNFPHQCSCEKCEDLYAAMNTSPVTAGRTRETRESDADLCSQIRILGGGPRLSEALNEMLAELRGDARYRARRALAALRGGGQ